MFKVLCIGDIHYKKDNLLWMDKFEIKVHQMLESISVDLIVVLGDTLDRFKDMTIQPHTQAMKFLRSLQDRVKVLLLIGNHDRINNNVFLTDESPFYACKFWNNTILCDDSSVFCSFNNDGHQFNFIGVPYVYPGRFQEALDRLKCDGKPIVFDDVRNTLSCIFGHQEFRDVKMGAITSKEGDIWPVDFPLTVNGHIHEHQKLTNNIMYTGNPDHEDTVSLYTFTKDLVEPWKEERIKLHLPMKIKLRLTVDETLLFVFKEDVLYKLKIFGTSAELKAMRLTDTYQKIRVNKNIKVITKTKDVNVDKGEMNDSHLSKKDRFHHSFETLINQRLLVYEEFRVIYRKIFE